MKKHIAVHLLGIVVLLALVLGGAFPPSQALTLEPAALAPANVAPGSPILAAPAQAPSAPAGLPPLELSVMDDPPLKVPFKLDLEMMLGPYYNTTTNRVNQPASWRGKTELPLGDAKNPPRIQGDVAAVAVGTERLLAVWHDVSTNALRSRVWWPMQGHHVTTDLELTPKGNPTLVSLTPEQAVLLARDENDFIQARFYEDTLDEPWGKTWKLVPGKEYRVGSDLAAVSKDSNHVALFFRDSGSGTVKFTEYQAGVDWRSEPLDLGNPLGTQIASELAAVSRGDRQVAVFGVGRDNVLYYREWTSYNESDWSDTEWKPVMDGVDSNGHIGAASRHNNHMVVAVWWVSGGAGYKEWLAESGWDTPRNIGSPLISPGATPTIAVTAIDTMVFLGVLDGWLRYKECKPGGQCGDWILVAPPITVGSMDST